MGILLALRLGRLHADARHRQAAHRRQLGSAATKGEGRQNLLCAYLAGALLVGLLGNAWFGAWWLDPVVGLLIAAVAVKEGREAWRGEGCCVSGPVPPGALASCDCESECCAHERRPALASEASGRP